MTRRALVSILLLVSPAAAGVRPAGEVSKSSEISAPSRAFTITYSVEIADIPESANRLQAWIPVPQTDDFQSVSELKIDSPIPYRFEKDPVFGNLILTFALPDRRERNSTQ